MKKIYTFLYITLILLSVFACTMPSELEITGAPSLKFAANMNFNDYFSDMIDEAVNSANDEGIKILPCTWPKLENKTFLLQMEIFRKDNYEFEFEGDFEGDIDQIKTDGSGTINISGINIPIPVEVIGGKFKVKKEGETGKQEEKITIVEGNEHYSTSSEGEGLDDYLKGFEFNEVKAKVYLYGTQLVKAVSIDISTNGEGPITLDGKDSRESSAVESLEEYLGYELPQGGVEIDISNIINNSEDLSFNYEIYIAEETEIDPDWLDDTHTIAAEIIIWLPLVFDSKEENASFNLSNFLGELGSVMKSLTETENIDIESMKINITIDPLNPFGYGVFVISDAGYKDINNSLDEHHFNINFTKEDLEYINNKDSYEPEFFILFPNKHSLLKIPNGDIMITTVSLDAKLRYNMEL